MINSLLDVSKIEAGELEPHRTENDLVAVARSAVAVLTALQGGRPVTIESDTEPFLFTFDRELIGRVIENFVGNALKFTDQTGTVKVDIRKAGTGVRVSVTDDGPGIAAEHHTRIFEKFGQVKTGTSRIGTGLGLAFCRLAVEVHGGKIGVRSALGQGSTFWFELPATEE
jgi:signal transduction histidine kinase